MSRRELTHHRGDLSPGPLHSTGRVQLREESKKHASSLPSAAAEHKMAPALRFCPLCRSWPGHNVREFGEAFKINVGRMCGTVVHPKTVIHRRGLGSGVAGGLHVDLGIA